MKKSVITALILLLAMNLTSADTEIDSLEKLLPNLTGEERVEVLNKMACEYLETDAEKSLEYCKTALAAAEELGSEALKAKAMLNMANSLRRAEKNKEAIERYEKCLKILKQLKTESERTEEIDRMTASALQNLGFIHFFFAADYDKALAYFLKAVKIAENTQDAKLTATCYIGIGFVHRNLENYQKALQYFAMGAEFAEKLRGKDRDRVVTALNETANVYFLTDDFEKSLQYHRKALKVAQEIDCRFSIGFVSHDMGLVYSQQGNYEKALECFFVSLEIDREMGTRRELSISLTNISSLYLRMGNLKSALKYQLEALEVAEPFGGRAEIASAYENLSKIYGETGDFQNALKYYKLFDTMMDSIYNESKSEQIAEMLAKYESEKKQSEIELLKKEKRIQTILRNTLIAGCTLILLVTFILYRSNRAKHMVNQALAIRNREIAAKNEELSELNQQLQNVIKEVKRLSGLLPICSSCKKIRDDAGYWKKIEAYISEHSDATFSHGICPDCMKKLYPEYYCKVFDDSGNIIDSLDS